MSRNRLGRNPTIRKNFFVSLSCCSLGFGPLMPHQRVWQMRLFTHSPSLGNRKRKEQEFDKRTKSFIEGGEGQHWRKIWVCCAGWTQRKGCHWLNLLDSSEAAVSIQSLNLHRYASMFLCSFRFLTLLSRASLNPKHVTPGRSPDRMTRFQIHLLDIPGVRSLTTILSHGLRCGKKSLTSDYLFLGLKFQRKERL